jgi:F-type H+-transporting ATPase subunit delta
MFPYERWATAFIETAGSSGADGDGAVACKAGIDLLTLFSRLVKNRDSSVFGLSAAKEADAFLATALGAAGYGGAADEAVSGGIGAERSGIEAARAFLFILIKRGEFKQLPLLIAEIERLASERAGNLDVKVEIAASADAAELDALKAALKKRYGVSSVNIKQSVKPELLAGYRLTIGSDVEDYSLSGKMKQLGSFFSARD